MPIVARVFSVRHLSEAKGGSATSFIVSRTMEILSGEKEIFCKVLPVVFDLCLNERVYTDELLLLLLALRARRVSKLHFTRRCVSLALRPEVHTFATETFLRFLDTTVFNMIHKRCINVFWCKCKKINASIQFVSIFMMQYIRLQTRLIKKFIFSCFCIVIKNCFRSYVKYTKDHNHLLIRLIYTWLNIHYNFFLRWQRR